MGGREHQHNITDSRLQGERGWGECETVGDRGSVWGAGLPETLDAAVPCGEAHVNAVSMWRC